MTPRKNSLRARAGMVMVLWIVGLTPMSAHSESEANGGPTSLVKAFEMATRNAPAMRSARHRIAAQRKAEKGARGALYPTVTLDARGARSEFGTASSGIDPQTLERTVTTTEVTETQTSVGLNLTQPLFDKRALETIDRARSETRTAEQQASAARHELGSRVAEAYVRVLREHAVLDLGRAEEEAFTLQVRQMQERLDRGLVDRIELLEAQVRLDEARLRIDDARNRLEVARLELERLIGEPVQRLRAATPVDMVGARAPGAKAIREWKQQAARKNPQVRVALQRLDTARRQVDVAQAERYPNLSLQLSYRDTDRTDQVVSGEQTRGMVVFEMPLFSGGQVSAGIDEASARASSERAEVDEARRRAVLDVRRAANELRTASRRLRTLERSLETAQTAVSSAQRGLDEGLRDRVDLLDARAREFRIRRDLADAAYNRLEALVQIRRLTGTMDSEQLAELDERYLNQVVDVANPTAPLDGQ